MIPTSHHDIIFSSHLIQHSPLSHDIIPAATFVPQVSLVHSPWPLTQHYNHSFNSHSPPPDIVLTTDLTMEPGVLLTSFSSSMAYFSCAEVSPWLFVILLHRVSQLLPFRDRLQLSGCFFCILNRSCLTPHVVPPQGVLLLLALSLAQLRYFIQ